VLRAVGGRDLLCVLVVDAAVLGRPGGGCCRREDEQAGRSEKTHSPEQPQKTSSNHELQMIPASAPSGHLHESTTSAGSEAGLKASRDWFRVMFPTEMTIET
jgi:hypothetical protein